MGHTEGRWVSKRQPEPPLMLMLASGEQTLGLSLGQALRQLRKKTPARAAKVFSAPSAHC